MLVLSNANVFYKNALCLYNSAKVICDFDGGVDFEDFIFNLILFFALSEEKIQFCQTGGCLDDSFPLLRGFGALSAIAVFPKYRVCC